MIQYRDGPGAGYDPIADNLQACLGRGSDSADCLNARQAEFQALGIPATDGKATAR